MNEAKYFRLVLAISLLFSIVAGGRCIYLERRIEWLDGALQTYEGLYSHARCEKPPFDCTPEAVKRHRDMDEWVRLVEQAEARRDVAQFLAWLPAALLLPGFYVVRLALTGRLRPIRCTARVEGLGPVKESKVIASSAERLLCHAVRLRPSSLTAKLAR